MINVPQDELVSVFFARCGLCDNKVPYHELELVEFQLSNDDWTERYVCRSCRTDL